MIYKWESEKERLLKFTKLSPKKKLEWLHQFHKFIVKYSSRHSNLIRWKLRKIS